MPKKEITTEEGYTVKQRRELTSHAINDMLYDLARLSTKDQVEKVLRDLLSPEELRDIGRRYLAARMLAEGETYLKIQARSAMSPPTIQKVNFKRKHGYGGFELLFGKKK